MYDFTAKQHFRKLPPGSLLLQGLTALIPSTAAQGHPHLTSARPGRAEEWTGWAFDLVQYRYSFTDTKVKHSFTNTCCIRGGTSLRSLPSQSRASIFLPRLPPTCLFCASPIGLICIEITVHVQISTACVQ